MTRWVDNRLDLGALGHIWVEQVVMTAPFAWRWCWYSPGGSVSGPYDLTSEARAKRAAESWLRRALKQAAKRVDDNAARRSK